MDLVFYILLPLVAFMYASVGHGGASGYLALMALFGVSTAIMKPTALTLNIVVAGIAFLQFWRRGYFRKEVFMPFVLSSIPAAFFGGFLNINADIYKQILGVLLLLAVVRMLGLFGVSSKNSKFNFWQALFIGAIIGFFSGLIGIGGGIILSPILLLLGWANVKETAAISALFIWVNSLAGLAGHITSGIAFHQDIIWLAGLGVLGGAGGAYLGSKVLNTRGLTRFLSLVLVTASIKLIFYT